MSCGIAQFQNSWLLLAARFLRCCPEGHRYDTSLEIKNGISAARGCINIVAIFSGEGLQSPASRFFLPKLGFFLRREEWRIRAMFL